MFRYQGKVRNEINHEQGRWRNGINDEEDKKYTKLGYHDIEIVKEFCCLGDMLGMHDSTGKAVTSRMRARWRKCKKLSSGLHFVAECSLTN